MSLLVYIRSIFPVALHTAGDSQLATTSVIVNSIPSSASFLSSISFLLSSSSLLGKLRFRLSCLPRTCMRRSTEGIWSLTWTRPNCNHGQSHFHFYCLPLYHRNRRSVPSSFCGTCARTRTSSFSAEMMAWRDFVRLGTSSTPISYTHFCYKVSSCS